MSEPGVPALIGVSGGRDSVALLHLLVRAEYSRLVVCHLDHGWRAESAEDARFVAELAAGYGLEAVVERLEKGRRRGSLETAGREARYAFFARVAAARGIGRVFLAHHADDQVETFLFNLLRGAGGPGLSGMQAVSRRRVEGTELLVLRPLLGCWRDEIAEYVRAHGLEFREDASNADRRHMRNRLRHEILPALAEAFGRPVRKTLWRAAAVLSAESEFVASRPELREVPAELTVRDVQALPVALQRRLIHKWLQQHGVAEIGFEEVESVRALLGVGRPAKTNLAGGWHARRRAGRLFLEK